MSKINAVRFINLNYNNNAIHISDEVFELNGESTLLSLQNGGGKSVFVQMMTAPFVHRRYRDAKDRPFESYFTTAKPTFILIEWALDQGAGYVTTGMMVRKNQNMSEGNAESLEMINLISEYTQPCLLDIRHLPVVEKGKKGIILKSFTACRQMFETYKKDSGVKFFYYDMTNSAQSKQYFEKLKEYQIHYKEWETIIKKVNLKESGLSELFVDCKDEKGLVEKWFLDTVESKLNKEKNRIAEFQSIVGKYVGLYKDNRTKIKRRDTIALFKEEGEKIRERAEQYADTDADRQAQENKIAHFIKDLNVIRDNTQSQYQEAMNRIEEIRREISHVKLEKLSGEIYQLEDEKRTCLADRDMTGMEQDEIEREVSRIENLLHLFACAKQQEAVENEKADLEEIKQKLLVSRQEDKEYEPERNALGYALKCYYEQELAANTQKQENNHAAFGQVRDEINIEKSKVSNLEEEIRKLASRQGGLENSVKMYGRQEDAFNSRYHENLMRNILGEYEAGLLEIQKESYEREYADAAKIRSNQKKELESLKENKKRLERNRDTMRQECERKRWEREEQEKLKGKYDEELEVRRVILQYLNLGSDVCFDRERILKVSESKLKEIAGLRRKLEKEEDKLQKEYQKLTQGKALELPEELEEELENMGIHIVYGMEWLKKNGYSEKQNLKIVHRHPFLPYALILSEQELNQLAQHAPNTYTSFPIPIIKREQLDESALEPSGSVIRLDGIHFYVLFNENLLNEEKLAILVREKEEEIGQKKEAIKIREQEYKEYFERQETIKNQSVSKERYIENEALLKELGQQIENLEQKLLDLAEALSQAAASEEKLEDAIRQSQQQMEAWKRRLEDFGQLCTAYEDYMHSRRELEKCRNEAERKTEQKKLAKNRLEQLHGQQKELELENAGLIGEAQKMQECLACYQGYGKPADDIDMRQELSIHEMEARFLAITANLSQELKSLEEQEQKAGKRYQTAKNELMHLMRKYGLQEDAWTQTRYNRDKELYQESALAEQHKKLEQKKILWNEQDKKIAVLCNKLDTCTRQMMEECGQETPLPREEVQNKDFDAVKNQLSYREKEIQKQAEGLNAHLKSYDDNLTSLAEYEEFTVKETVEWEEDFTYMDAKQLRTFKGILVRDYKHTLEECRNAKDHLTESLNRVVRMEEFREDYYRKPLESMLELTDDASQVLQQLNTTIQSYDDLMEKLIVDISLVEKEKDNVISLMEDYIKDVHINLCKIDSNSTITVRNRSLKMLKLQAPEWEENESLYHIRLGDMIDEITQKGIALFEQNENAQEYFGTRITTRNLYDTVIGIGNVQIKLYKIEAQREYPITWTEVARNSGGEGFLSAFVILSSLLYYMRKDDTDIFADRNEGKVLIMDNPFAQTNAAHLLKPLMDMARKTNTQLICLTGLSGESIYNCFDNIYVLNLIAATLKSGMQYLKVNHIKGNEPDTLVVSQIEVLEQQELTLF